MPESRLPHFKFERAFAGIVCGVDEVGRGPLAGPVVAAAVILPRRLPRPLAREVDDSKKLSPADRERLDVEIRACAMVGVGEASVAEIDSINILQAAFLAMRRAVAALASSPDLALVDGNQHPGLPMPCRMVIGGDGIHLSIAAASIVAKVVRDRSMIALAEAHPEYGWRQQCRLRHAGASQRIEEVRPDAASPHVVRARARMPRRKRLTLNAKRG